MLDMLTTPLFSFKCLLFFAGNLQSLVVPAAALGVLGYGYMWWKVRNLDFGRSL